MSDQQAPTLTKEEAIARAEALAPKLAERALETERLRRIPEETVHELKASGLLRLANPRRFGGYGLEYDAALEVGTVLARGCGSTGWCYMVWSSHQWLLGLYPEPVQEEYFGSSPDVLASSAFNPARGKAEKVDGGYRLSGRWDFSSGCDAAQWAVLAAFTQDKGPGLFLVPRQQYTIVDTWFVSGLRGTGSRDIVIQEPVFVPEERFLSYEAMGTATTPGRQVHPNRVSYRLPLYPLFSFTLVAPLIGIAEGALRQFVDQTRERVTAFDGQRMAALVPIQIAVGEAAAETDTAHLIMRHDLDELLTRAARAETLSWLDRVRFRRDHAFIAKLCVQAVDCIFAVAGGRSLYEDSPLQRAHRDVNAGAHQIAVIWHTYAQQYGRVALGLEPTDMVV